MHKEIFSGNNKYVAVLPHDENGYFICLVQGAEDNPLAYDTDYQIGFVTMDKKEFHIDSTLAETVIDLEEVYELTQKCIYQKPELRVVIEFNS